MGLRGLTRCTTDLSESLEQQTATSEVLRVISSSPNELGPVFETMLGNATRLCDANFGLLLLYEGDWRFRVVAIINAPAVFAELRLREPNSRGSCCLQDYDAYPRWPSARHDWPRISPRHQWHRSFVV
jgi:hypothetical protein